MRYNLNTRTDNANLGECPNCGHSITDHSLLSDYALCETCARSADAEAQEQSAAQRRLEDMCSCMVCNRLIVDGDVCENSECKRIAAKLAYITAMTRYANERAIAKTMPRCGANLPAFVAQMKRVLNARESAEQALYQYAIKYMFQEQKQ